jgi:hypothetical protein
MIYYYHRRAAIAVDGDHGYYNKLISCHVKIKYTKLQYYNLLLPSLSSLINAARRACFTYRLQDAKKKNNLKDNSLIARALRRYRRISQGAKEHNHFTTTNAAGTSLAFNTGSFLPLGGKKKWRGREPEGERENLDMTTRRQTTTRWMDRGPGPRVPSRS